MEGNDIEEPRGNLQDIEKVTRYFYFRVSRNFS